MALIAGIKANKAPIQAKTVYKSGDENIYEVFVFMGENYQINNSLLIFSNT